eukprot:CAMPEP_0115520684 /NCGR_PEP_ID=MMETSP0271-20121206/79124_1 /TAXON_ID=71861 /ORGANISM="Scrippsiella trochoidea, Strain CCMP3099" /LENGTH=126 /DNA_ID=CAMNT_0002951825 /DNA_START=15 /DNA_END=391 /DNA_ORIENTATION=+
MAFWGYGALRFMTAQLCLVLAFLGAIVLTFLAPEWQSAGFAVTSVAVGGHCLIFALRAAPILQSSWRRKAFLRHWVRTTFIMDIIACTSLVACIGELVSTRYVCLGPGLLVFQLRPRALQHIILNP